MRNPLYHWTHLELSRIFGVDKVLNPSTAREIYDECTAKLQTPEFRAQANHGADERRSGLHDRRPD